MLSETIEGVKLKKLEAHMGWRFQYPERYSRDEAWDLLLHYGTVVMVEVYAVETIEGGR
jgi:hypothetical protein